MHSSTAARALHRATRSLQHHPSHNSPFRLLSQSQQRSFHPASSVVPPLRLRKQHPYSSPLAIACRLRHQQHQLRLNSTDTTSSSQQQRPLTDRQDTAQPVSEDAEEIAARRAQEPAYEMTFTCRKCMNRSSHRVTKQAYHFGTTLVTCPGCKNRHLISDNLKIFSDKNLTLEDILREKGQLIKKGVLGEDGDVEFVDESKLPKEMKQVKG
ncbi:zf-DNL-domain-containing protein [Polychaeton citri CBS 116435]|uniref:Zf-DNL-domain-containing protein n=1 Tax=Polychaeton citri CBS 116435 TaxID=1314669 RepID=A0A9P4URU7_9PEZI|nr:zf-DNL-domain-containing protein [Polychaeton citri CBS 116435]